MYHVNEVWLRYGEGKIFTEDVDQASDMLEGAGERVRAVRKRAGLTQAAFAEAIGYSRIHIYHVETNKEKPSKELLERVSQSFRASFSWLLTGKGDMNDEDPKDEVDDELIRWLNDHKDVVLELRRRMNLHK